MKLFRTFAMVVALGGLSTAALAEEAKPKAPDTKKVDPPKEPAAEDVKKWLGFFDKVVDAVVADKDKCDQMATDLNALFASNADLIKAANEAKAAGKKLPKDAQDHMLAGIKKMAPSMQGCIKNEKVKAAFQKFDGKDGKATKK